MVRAYVPEPLDPTEVPYETIMMTDVSFSISIFTVGPGSPVYVHIIVWVLPAGHTSPPFGVPTAMVAVVFAVAGMTSAGYPAVACRKRTLKIRRKTRVFPNRFTIIII